MQTVPASGYIATMKKRLIILFLGMGLSGLCTAQTLFSDPDKTANDVFWHELYKDGGVTFFCQKPFKGKSFLLSTGYIYPLSHVRNALHCGTPSQCERDSDTYRYIASDLHNLIPVETRIEMRRRNAKYAQLGDRVASGDCGIREGVQNIEPPDNIKGDVARAVSYMVHTYDLPMIGSPQVFANWDQADPPDDAELTRNKRINELQGNDNPFVSGTEQMNNI